MSAAASLTAWGLQQGADIVELAAAAGLSLPIAATLLEKESGGRNVWGSDGVQTGGAYVKGGPVTRDNYLAYRALVRAGKIGRQGVGPGQLTYGGFQDEADRRGGCWDWRINARYSFEILRGLQAQYGTRDGFRRYNGSGPAAERYAADAMVKLARWRDRLGTTSPAPTPAQPAAPALEDDMFTDEDRRIAREIHAKLHGVHRTRVDFGLLGEPPADHVDDVGGYAINADARAYETRELLTRVMLPKLVELRTEVLAALAAARDQNVPGQVVELAEGGDIEALAERVVDRFIARLA